jgi:hypothetical protein
MCGDALEPAREIGRESGAVSGGPTSVPPGSPGSAMTIPSSSPRSIELFIREGAADDISKRIGLGGEFLERNMPIRSTPAIRYRVRNPPEISPLFYDAAPFSNSTLPIGQQA